MAATTGHGNASVHMLFHTNRPLRPFRTAALSTADEGSFNAVAGWWGDQAAQRLGAFPVTGRYRSPKPTAKKLKAKWNLPQSLKFEWSLNASRSANADVWMLADTDVVVQCSPREIREAFESFRSPLVVGTENWLFPRPNGARGRRDPFEQACNGPSEGLRYPNSGLVMGTRAGFESLVREAKLSQPLYPCCSFYRPEVECFVDDQACMQSGLLRLKLATWRGSRRPHERRCAPPLSRRAGARTHHRDRSSTRGEHRSEASAMADGPSAFRSGEALPSVSSMASAQPAPLPSSFHGDGDPPSSRIRTVGNTSGVNIVHHDSGSVDFALDVHARLFLNLFMVHSKDLRINARGQLVHAKTGTAPCVVHTNAYKSPDLIRELLAKWTGVTWLPGTHTRIQKHYWQQQASR